MNKAIYYKYMFIFAGTWNMGVALLFGLLTPLIPSFLPFFGLAKPDTYLWLYSFLLLMGMFGFKYLLVGLDFTKNHLVVSIGIFSKFAFFFVLLTFFIIGDCNVFLLLFGVADLVFAVLFIEFYINFKKLDTSLITEAYAPLKKE